jgi:hypothetical protein
MARLWQQVERISGADHTRVMQFVASGMLLNVFAAMDCRGSRNKLGEASPASPERRKAHERPRGRRL